MVGYIREDSSFQQPWFQLQIPTRDKADTGRAAQHHILALPGSAAKTHWHHFNFTYAPRKEREAVIYLSILIIFVMSVPKVQTLIPAELLRAAAHGAWRGPWEPPVQHNVHVDKSKLSSYLSASGCLLF